ncbi:MAG: DNA-binding response OmpR family regulator [Bradymonadia bacterium]|jgi:DNA-binding response OmpR family regulator
MAPTVLIVESDEQSASQLARAFDAAGFAVSRSADAEDAWRRIERGKPRIVVLCAELAGTGGYRLCKKIKTSASTSTIPVFLTSSTASAEVFDLHSKRAYRAEAYFRKPVRPEAVAAHAATLVGGSGDDDIASQFADLIADLDEVPAAARDIDTRNVDSASDLARRQFAQDASLSASPPAVPSATGDNTPGPAPDPSAAPSWEPLELTPSERALLHDEADDLDGTGEALDEGQTDVRDMTEMFGRAAEAAATRQLHGEIERLSDRIGELEGAQAGTLADLASARERVRAREAELEVMRGSHQSGARRIEATSERELLSVREALSAKEREVLDLRDERHAKDRDAIGLRDQLSALATQAREDTDELGDVRARLGAAEQSRDAALDRARASDASLSTAQNEAELRERAAMADLAALNRRVASAANELDTVQVALESSETDVESSRQAVLELHAELSDAQTLAAQTEARWESENERATIASTASDALSAELLALRASSSVAMLAVESDAATRIAAAQDAVAEQVDTIKADAAMELATSSAAAESQLFALRSELSELTQASANEVATLREALEMAGQATLAAAAGHQSELSEMDAALSAQLSALQVEQDAAASAAEAQRESMRLELQGSNAELRVANAALKAVNAALVLENAKALAMMRESLMAEHAGLLEAQRQAAVTLADRHAEELEFEGALREEASLAHSLELAGATDAAERQLTELRQSLDVEVAAKTSALVAATSEHEAALVAAAEHEAALVAATSEREAALVAAAEHEAALVAATSEHEAALVAAAEHEAALVAATAEREAALTAATSEQQAALAVATSEHEAALAAATAERDVLLAEAAVAQQAALAVATSEHEAALAAATAERDVLLAEAAVESQASLESAAAEAATALESARIASEYVAQQLRLERAESLESQSEQHAQQSAAFQLSFVEERTSERAEHAEETTRARVRTEAALEAANERGAALLAAAVAEERRAGLVIASLLQDVQAVTASEASLRERAATSERALASLVAAARAAAASLPEEPVATAERGAGESLIEWQAGRQSLEWSPVSLEFSIGEVAEPVVEDPAEVELRDAAEASRYASSGLPADEEESEDEPTEVDGAYLSGNLVESEALPAAPVERRDDGNDSDLSFEVSAPGEPPQGSDAATAETQQTSDPEMLRAVQEAQSVRQAVETEESMLDSSTLAEGGQPDGPKRAEQNTTVEVGVKARAESEEPDIVRERQPSFDLTGADERVELSESGVPITSVEASERGDAGDILRVESTTSVDAPGDALAEAQARADAFDRSSTRNDVELVDVEDRFVVEELSDLSSMDDALVDLNEDDIDEDDFV